MFKDSTEKRIETTRVHKNDMNYLEFYTDEEQIIKEADKRFQIATVIPATKNGEWDKHKIGVYDTRSEKEMRAVLRQLYTDCEPIV